MIQDHARVTFAHPKMPMKSHIKISNFGTTKYPVGEGLGAGAGVGGSASSHASSGSIEGQMWKVLISGLRVEGLISRSECGSVSFTANF